MDVYYVLSKMIIESNLKFYEIFLGFFLEGKLGSIFFYINFVIFFLEI